MEDRKCMNCKTVTTRVDGRDMQLWYKVKKDGEVIGYHCARCYDKIRRLPLFQNFKQKLKERVCSNCGSDKTLFHLARGKYPYNKWYKDGKGGFWCNCCYHKITDDPQKTRAINERRMKFKDKVIHIEKNPRTGVCSLCGNKVGEGIKRTGMHHIEYHDRNPLKDTVELCGSCHIKESMKKYGVRSLRWKTPL
jgi:DNA-directed RNA polymerase subunit RPC12/RpoP